MILPEWVQIRSMAEAENVINTLYTKCCALEQEVRRLDEENDTFLRTPWWKRTIFRLDGWSGHKLQDQPRWRPWRRWWKS